LSGEIPPPAPVETGMTFQFFGQIGCCLKSRNPLTAKDAIRSTRISKDRKEQISNIIALRALHLLCVLCG